MTYEVRAVVKNDDESTLQLIHLKSNGELGLTANFSPKRHHPVLCDTEEEVVTMWNTWLKARGVARYKIEKRLQLVLH